MSEPKRMHPISIVLLMLKLIKDAIIPLVLGFIAFFRNLSEMFWWSPFALIGAVLLVSGLAAFLHWYRFTYRIEADELRLESGFFVRKKRYISKHRIHSVNTSANILHRLFGIVKLEVQTAGGGNKAEGKIGALSKEDAAAILQFVKRKEQEDDGITELKEDLLSEKQAGYQLSFQRLLAAAATSGGTGVFFGFLFTITQQLDNIADFDIYSFAFDWLLEQSLVLSILFVIGSLAITWMIAMVGTILKYCFFEISKQGEELFVRRGLLEKREITIPLHRIQALKIEENIFRQPLGLLAVSAEIAGGAESDKHNFSTILFPLLKRSELQQFLEEIVPGYVTETAFRKPPKRAWLRYAFVPTLISVLITGVLVYFLNWYGLLAILLILLTVWFCVLDYKDAGVSWTADMLTMRYRELSRVTVHVPRKKVQAFRESQHYFQSKKQLESVKISVASGGAAGSSFKVKHLAEEDAQAAADWYSFRS
ncbi:PH domain-containing protein [Terribacillus sp. DMT04]|uniref:PH domain-containing protein n=1 Tax=Terribacillus sp. DMT04 TaxID=2850441 RepID=UPI001C2B9342|nr:PH domain-containing protein [Terribacillus sp. DMT04]QXE02225.1 PH domain-containing protein [Terribacillus sp. DMT04]